MFYIKRGEAPRLTCIWNRPCIIRGLFIMENSSRCSRSNCIKNSSTIGGWYYENSKSYQISFFSSTVRLKIMRISTDQGGSWLTVSVLVPVDRCSTEITVGSRLSTSGSLGHRLLCTSRKGKNHRSRVRRETSSGLRWPKVPLRPRSSRSRWRVRRRGKGFRHPGVTKGWYTVVTQYRREHMFVRSDKFTVTLFLRRTRVNV